MITALRPRKTMLKKMKRICRLKKSVREYFEKYPDNPLKRGVGSADLEYIFVETDEDTNLEITGVNPDGTKILTYRPAVTSNDLARHNPIRELREKKMQDMKKAVEKAAKLQPATVEKTPAVEQEKLTPAQVKKGRPKKGKK